MQNSTSKEYEDLIALRDEKKKILELRQQNLDELLKKRLNHEEPPWRTPLTKGWWDRMKDEKNKIKAWVDLDGGSDEMAEEIELRRRKDENTWN